MGAFKYSNTARDDEPRGKIEEFYVLASTTPGAVLFQQAEAELISEANVILVTGWTHEEYLSQPASVVDAVMQVNRGNERIRAMNEGRKIERLYGGRK